MVGYKDCNFQSQDTAKCDLCLFYVMQTLCFAADFARHWKSIFDECFSSAIQKSILNPC